jgi:phosphoenolpyruvate---glycerone phosphotransferase subunit DhaK
VKKLLNKPEDFVVEMLEGILAAHGGALRAVGSDPHCLVRSVPSPRKDKVGIVTGGGSGHLPLFLGYVGAGLLDGVAIGNVFASPSAKQMFEVTKAVDRGRGVLYLYGNYSGDVINFEMASEMAEMAEIKTLHVKGNDDAASSVKGEEQKRRGVAGLFFAYKAAGAAAEAGLDLGEVSRVAQKAVDRTRTVGVALSPCIIPEVGKPGFTIGDDEMEIGMGIHGEKGIHRTKLMTADDTVDAMLDIIRQDMAMAPGERVAVLVNGLGATPLEELYIVYRRVHELLGAAKVDIRCVYVGEFATSMEMSGMSISVIRLDDELESYLNTACDTPFFKQF